MTDDAGQDHRMLRGRVSSEGRLFSNDRCPTLLHVFSPSLHYPVIKLHFDKERVAFSGDMEPYLKALFEAMKTKPKAVERTITYYPEAVEVRV